MAAGGAPPRRRTSSYPLSDAIDPPRRLQVWPASPRCDTGSERPGPRRPDQLGKRRPPAANARAAERTAPAGPRAINRSRPGGKSRAFRLVCPERTREDHRLPRSPRAPSFWRPQEAKIGRLCFLRYQTRNCPVCLGPAPRWPLTGPRGRGTPCRRETGKAGEAGMGRGQSRARWRSNV